MKQEYRHMMEQVKLDDAAREAILSGIQEKKVPRRTARPLRVALIAACVCLALVGTAFAANAATSGLVFDKLGLVVTGRFERAQLVDENGNWIEDLTGIDIKEKLESGKYTMLYPSYVTGVQLTEEEGRVVLYAQNAIIEVQLDITDELLENGTFHYEEKKGGYSLSLTVYSVVLEEYADHDPGYWGYPLVYEGAAYLVKGSGSGPNAWGGSHNFEFSDMRGFYANS